MPAASAISDIGRPPRVKISCSSWARRLRVFLYEDLGFRGNRHAFKDPRNSFLNEVLNRRLGIPITLSILFMELARAAGFEARGVALPGHFVVRLSYNGRTILVDPFHGATVISEEDCRQLVSRSTGKPGLFLREQLEGTDERHMLGRMLRNLKQIYVEREDFARALSIVERLLILRPGDSLQIRDSGYIKAHLGQPGGAISDLETYLSRSPQARDNASVRAHPPPPARASRARPPPLARPAPPTRPPGLVTTTPMRSWPRRGTIPGRNATNR